MKIPYKNKVDLLNRMLDGELDKEHPIILSELVKKTQLSYNSIERLLKEKGLKVVMKKMTTIRSVKIVKVK